MSLIALTEDHHNLRWLVELLPDSMRGKQLRRHLSVSAISKLLNNRCTYIPSNTEFQLSDLRRYLPRMRPSSLLRGLATSFRRSQNPHREREEEEEDCASLDQQVSKGLFTRVFKGHFATENVYATKQVSYWTSAVACPSQLRFVCFRLVPNSYTPVVHVNQEY